ncbi:SMC-Scp complex subunit ScpB [Candidatus Wolfebacteria bacterium]|nr:SMC-Scp complex subunit ScpB [Candidatus Wolfebacteria bacterium]
MQLDVQIESILFFKAEPVSFIELQKMLGVSAEELEKGIHALTQTLSGRGVRLMQSNNAVMLATAPDMADTIQKLTQEDLQKDLGKAGVETLAIVLYRGPVTCSQVDYIRGVNSTYILRHLLTRGFVEKIHNPKDSRSYLYQPTFELLAYLGLARIEDLPEYAVVRSEIDIFEKAHDTPSEPAQET